MVSEAICNDNEMLGNKNNKIWKDVRKKCVLTNMTYEQEIKS